MSSPGGRALKALALGESFLAASQRPDGLWCDYELEPGESEAWTTACTAWVLGQPPCNPRWRAAILWAADALHWLRRPTGWGYNRRTGTDGDSTAWAWRLLALVDDFRTLTPEADLRRYLTGEGQAVTFQGRKQFGSWAFAHADVTPVVGMALVATGAAPSLIAQVREAALGARTDGRLWRSFWWSTDSYAVARNLEFLAVSGGIPAETAAVAAQWLERHGPGESAFETAHLLTVAALLHQADVGPGAAGRAAEMLQMQQADGGWPPSAVLLVPPQFGPAGPAGAAAPAAQTTRTRPNADGRRLMSTAMAVHALKQWLRSGGAVL